MHKRTIDFVNSFYEKIVKIHPNLDFTNSVVINSKTKIEYLCKFHGIQKASPTELLLGKGCKKCGYLRVKSKLSLVKKENLLKKLQTLHDNKYEYLNLQEYENNRSILKIKCPIHGIFKQTAALHLSGAQCKKCQDSKREGAWKYGKWEEIANKSKYFDSFKLYILKCWSNDEEFFKIGKTFRNIKERFGCKKWLPYNYIVIKVIEGNAKDISELEYFLKNKNKKYSYIPKNKFNGITECFKKIDYE